MRRAVFFAAVVLLSLSGALFGLEIGDPLPDINGLVVQYEKGRTLNVRVEDHRLVVYFFDENRRVMACPFEKVIIRVDRLSSNGKDLNLVMRASPEVPYVTSPRFIKPPYAFRVHLLMYPVDGSNEGCVSLPTVPFRWKD